MNRHLLEPVTDQGVRSVKFFNGRLLVAEDLSQEQAANEARRRQLRRAVGVGVAYGLEVSRKDAHIITVEEGLAFNCQGQAVALGTRIDIDLVTAPKADATSNNGRCPHQDCESVPAGLYVAGEGVYVLLVSPTSTAEGRAEVSGLGNSPAKCNARYCVEGVQFRLQLVTGLAELSDATYLRNRIAYRCFGYLWHDTSPLAINSCGNVPERYGLIDDLVQQKAVTCCEVPLALMRLTASEGITFIDLYAVRRRLTHVAVTHPWNTVMGDRRQSEGESIFLQFQDQLSDIANESNLNLKDVAAAQRLKFLPAAAYLPVGSNGFDWRKFLGTLAPASETKVDAGLLRSILHSSFYEDPILIDSTPKAAVDVYVDPSQTDCVLFARSAKGRIRVSFNPVPGSVDIYARQGNCSTHYCPFTGTDPAILDLYPGDYDVYVSAPGFQAVNSQTATVVGAEQVELTFTLTPQQATTPPPAKPSKCVSIKNQSARLRGGRLCMVSEVPNSFTLEKEWKMAMKGEGPPIPRGFEKLEDDGVAEWLSLWRKALKNSEGRNSSRIAPAVYIRSDYKPPQKWQDVPAQPQAYAVFPGRIVPLLVNDSLNLTKRPIPLAVRNLQAVSAEQIDALKKVGITNLDHLSGAWSQIVTVAVDQSRTWAATLIMDAINATKRANQAMTYYPGLDQQIKEILVKNGIVGDVSLANANWENLGPKLEDQGAVFRYVVEARKIVPPDSWSLESLGIGPGSIPGLNAMGIQSQGDLAAAAEDKTMIQKVAKVLGTDTAFVSNLGISAITKMTAGAITQRPEADLTTLPGVNGIIIDKLQEANIKSTADLAAANASDLAKETKLPASTIANLKAAAAMAGRGSLAVSDLPTATGNIANKLKTSFGVSTVAELASKKPQDIKEAFGGDTAKATAVIEGAKAALGGRMPG